MLFPLLSGGRICRVASEEGTVMLDGILGLEIEPLGSESVDEGVGILRVEEEDVVLDRLRSDIGSVLGGRNGDLVGGAVLAVDGDVVLPPFFGDAFEKGKSNSNSSAANPVVGSDTFEGLLNGCGAEKNAAGLAKCGDMLPLLSVGERIPRFHAAFVRKLRPSLIVLLDGETACPTSLDMLRLGAVSTLLSELERTPMRSTSR